MHTKISDIKTLPLLNISTKIFGKLSSGKVANLYTLTNKELTISITNYGGIITGIEMPDKNGDSTDVVLGYDTVKSYETDPYYLGAIIGRYAGRIKNGKININNTPFQLSLNSIAGNNKSQLHGGENALNKQLWQAETKINTDKVSLILTYHCPDKTNGFPGNIDFTVKYTLNNKNEFTVEYFAHTDKPTVINLTQHSYFNLAGHHSGSILNHQVYLNADHFLPMDKYAYPTGEIRSVENTPHNFKKLVSLNHNINNEDQQIKIGCGYDNYWLLNVGNNNEKGEDNKQSCSVKIIEPNSGRRLKLYTDQPSIILYTGNYLNGSRIGKNNVKYQIQHGLCIEPQRAFSHAMSKEDYKPYSNVLLKPEKPFYSKNVYVFDSVKS